MLRRLNVLAFLTLLLSCLLVVLKPGPMPFAIPSAARAQEPIPVPLQQGPELRDPARVASELLVDPSSPTFTAHDYPAQRWANSGYVNDIGSAVVRLRRQVVQMQRDANTDLRGEQRRLLTRAADNALDALDDFQTRLVIGRSLASVSADFADVETRVSALTHDARAYGLDRTGSRDSAEWIALADRRLSEAVAQGQARETWAPALVAREADALVFHARDLERQGEYGLTGGVGRRSLQGDLHALTDSAEFFRASLASGSSPARLTRDFTSVEEVWAQVGPAIEHLSRAERQLLDPRAIRVADVVFKLRRRLGVAGPPASAEPIGAPIPLGGTAVAEPTRARTSNGLVLPASAPR